ncbi:hypothetical protein MLD38_034933 [Melastoma candidum]|uniref:Uncharacterized protein n=1 Tax=Melastoma candidum TaxID=119954 RepID=A0ACB9MB94_9MYRT|nr:hypothetical protein MLD38_034933 [Melastoma candidum]
MATAPPADVPSFTTSSGQVSDDYPLLSLAEAIRGYPATVDSDKNPLVCPLADLNGDVFNLQDLERSYE